ncbi:hypothetical protein AB0F17_23530 [Nonomuraea sp. NPDC026600]|uniref:endonuclease/exonuclease/phosphatase family protein n=1 Tax=Nonomuraea sp. NPDC026600 TaxID=3155363 RepID=UPI0033C839A6
MSSDGLLKIATWNFETFGFDQASRLFERLHLLPGVISAVPDVDILIMQEVWQGAVDGSRLLFEVEELLSPFTNWRGALRAFHSPPKQGDSCLGEVVVLRWPRIRPVRHYVNGAPDLFHDQAGFLHVVVEGLKWSLKGPLKIKSLHWPYWSGDERLSQALKLTGHAAGLSLLAGDCNGLWPGEAEFEPDWEVRPPHKRHHKTLPPGMHPTGQRWLSDRRALQVLAESEFVNAGALAKDFTPTVLGHIDDGQGARIDHILYSPGLAAAVVPNRYRVHHEGAINRAGDHALVEDTMDLDRLAA